MKPYTICTQMKYRDYVQSTIKDINKNITHVVTAKYNSAYVDLEYTMEHLKEQWRLKVRVLHLVVWMGGCAYVLQQTFCCTIDTSK